MLICYIYSWTLFVMELSSQRLKCACHFPLILAPSIMRSMGANLWLLDLLVSVFLITSVNKGLWELFDIAALFKGPLNLVHLLLVRFIPKYMVASYSLHSLCIPAFSSQPPTSQPLLLPHNWKALSDAAGDLCIGMSSALFSVFIIHWTSFHNCLCWWCTLWERAFSWLTAFIFLLYLMYVKWLW